MELIQIREERTPIQVQYDINTQTGIPQETLQPGEVTHLLTPPHQIVTDQVQGEVQVATIHLRPADQVHMAIRALILLHPEAV